MPRGWHHLKVYFGLAQPDHQDKASEREAREAARRSLRTPSWWTFVVVIGLTVGAAVEVVAAALGDRSFDLNGAGRVSAVAILVPIFTTMFGAAGND